MKNLYGQIKSRSLGVLRRSRPGVLAGYEKITLHCGLHKTGTSFIQTVLHDNAAVLEKHGIEYPTALRPSVLGNRGNHGLIVKRYAESGDLDAVLRDFTTIGYRSPTLLLSGEGFSNYFAQQPESLAAFLEAASGAEVEFVFYLRRPDHLYESVYAQTVKKRVSGDISNAAFRFDFYERLMPFVEAVGKENVTIRPYNRKLWPNGELGADFCRTVGEPELWKEIAPTSEKIVNASLNRNQVFLLSQIETVIAKKRLRQYFAENPEGLPDDGGKFFLSPEERREINARHAEANQRLADLFDLGDMDEFLGIADDEDHADWRPYRPDWEMLFGYLARFMDHERRR